MIRLRIVPCGSFDDEFDDGTATTASSRAPVRVVFVYACSGIEAARELVRGAVDFIGSELARELGRRIARQAADFVDAELARMSRRVDDLRRGLVQLNYGYRPATPPAPYHCPRLVAPLNAGMHWRRMRRSSGLARART